MIQQAPRDFDAEILEAMVAPARASLPPAVAKALLSCEFQPQQKAEIEKLLTRNSAGTIKPGERDKLAAYVRIGNFLSLLKAKARASLSDKPSRK